MNDGIRLDVDESGPLPWPSDAVMIVAARAGTENRAAMEGVNDATCRRCDAHLHADTRTIRTAEQLPQRMGRPVMFFCVECALLHNRNQIQTLIDQRDGQHKVMER
jgi:hypothetical protein